MTFTAVVLSALVAASPGEPQGAARFSIEARGMNISGPGIDDGPFHFDKRISEIDEGDGFELIASGRIGDRWYWRAAYGLSRYEYGNPRDFHCPLNAASLLDIQYLCQAAIHGRFGTIDDHAETMRAVIGYEYRWGTRFRAFVEGGYGRIEWDTRDDIEANLLVDCRGFGVGFDPSSRNFPVSPCERVSDSARDDGLVGSVGGAVRAMGPMWISLAWNYQDFTYRPFRNDAIEDFLAANCEENARCQERAQRRLPDHIADNWDWWRLEVSRSLGENWVAAIGYESGGSRDWDVATFALRYEWR